MDVTVYKFTLAVLFSVGVYSHPSITLSLRFVIRRIYYLVSDINGHYNGCANTGRYVLYVKAVIRRRYYSSKTSLAWPGILDVKLPVQ